MRERRESEEGAEAEKKKTEEDVEPSGYRNSEGGDEEEEPPGRRWFCSLIYGRGLKRNIHWLRRAVPDQEEEEEIRPIGRTKRFLTRKQEPLANFFNKSH